MSNATWMADMQDQIGGLTLRQVVLPGTHDSGTYAIGPNSEIAPDAEDKVQKIEKKLGVVARTIVTLWAVAQGQNIRQQLESGIRYLDLRVCRRHGNEMYIVHSLYSDNVNAVIDAVKSFVDENPKEIVLLDISHFFEMTKESHEALAKKLKDSFGKKLVPRSKTVDTKLEDLWKENQRVIVLYYGDDKAKDIVKAHPEFWTQDSISSPWGNKQKLEDLRLYLNHEVQNPAMDKFFVLQGILTPDTDMIIAGGLAGGSMVNPINLIMEQIKSSGVPLSLPHLASQVTPAVLNWCKEEWFDKNLNIIMVDWAEKFPVVEVAKALSKAAVQKSRLDPQSQWVKNDDWNNEYWDRTMRDIYVDTSEVVCPAGKVVVGIGFYRKGGPSGNRIAPKLLCVTPGESFQEWVQNDEWNDHNYFGPLEKFYADINAVVCPEGKVVTGFAFHKKGGPTGNRLAPRIRCASPDGKDQQWLQNDDWNQLYWNDALKDNYIDTNKLECKEGSAVLGFSLRKKGNRLAPMILSGPMPKKP